MKVWIKAGVIIFYVLVYCFLRKRMRRDIVKLFKAYMLLMIFLLSLLPEPFMLKHLGVTLRADTLHGMNIKEKRIEIKTIMAVV